jgi:SAM-dependent methyltransferase
VSAVSFDRVADRYDRTRAVPPAAVAAITQGIVDVLGPRPLLLEVGVGTGRIAAPLAAAGVRVAGIDVARQMLGRLVAKGTSVMPVVADAQAPPFRPATFDGALFVHVLHLVPNALAVVRAAGATVRPGGALVLGRTEFAPSPFGEVIGLVWRTVAELGGPPFPREEWNAAARAAFATGAALFGAEPYDETVARWTETTSGRRILDDLAGRIYSSTWAIADDVMPALLARLEPEVAALAGGLDQPIESAVAFTLTIARVPERVQ